jgi:YfiR/HmsC-like
MRRPRRNPVSPIRWGTVRRQPSRLAVTTFAALLFVAGARWVSAQGDASSEYQVKAAFLFHFAQFVDWPSEAFKDAGAPLTYCMAGGDPFRGALDASLNEKVIDGRPVRVLHFREAQEIQGCQVLFIGIADKKFISATLANLKGRPVLTVGESEHFVQEEGMIGFVLEDNKVRFEINLTATEHAKLKISARLLSLAKTVIGSPKGT